MSYMETDFTEMKESLTAEMVKTSKLEDQLRHMKTEHERKDKTVEQTKQMEYLSAQNDQLSQQIREIDAYSRRSNLIFDGISQVEPDTPLKKVQDIITNTMGLNAAEMKIERCHRLQGSKMSPKPIIVRFNWFVNRQEVWANRRNLKGTKIYLREDFPQVVQKVRRSLGHTLTLARMVDKRANLKKD